MNFETDEQGRAAIDHAAFESRLNRDKIDVNPFIGINSKLMDCVAIHFPGGHGMGTYEQILSVIKESKSFEELARECLRRRLWRPDSAHSV